MATSRDWRGHWNVFPARVRRLGRGMAESPESSPGPSPSAPVGGRLGRNHGHMLGMDCVPSQDVRNWVLCHRCLSGSQKHRPSLGKLRVQVWSCLCLGGRAIWKRRDQTKNDSAKPISYLNRRDKKWREGESLFSLRPTGR